MQENSYSNELPPITSLLSSRELDHDPSMRTDIHPNRKASQSIGLLYHCAIDEEQILHWQC